MPEIDRKRQTLAGQLASLEARVANQIPSQSWRDLKAREHDRAFTVAGAMKADLLNDLANAVNDSISKGLGLDYFQKQFDKIVAKHGWSHNGERRWRARLIYQTNMRVSYAAGRLQQLRDPELMKLKPFWMYRHNGAENPRLQHVAWDKMVLPADDPAWRNRFPPKGYGCGCSVTAIDKDDIERLGGRLVESADHRNNDGVDEGWEDHLPGTAADLDQVVRQKAAALPEQLALPLTDEASTRAAISAAVRDVVQAGNKVGKEIEFAALVKGSKKLWQKKGGKREVSFNDAELDAMQDAVLVHNHPSSTSLSKADLKLAARRRLRTIIAAGNDANVYDASPIADEAKLSKEYDRVSFDAYGMILARIQKGLVSAEEAEKWHSHVVNTTLHKLGMIRYTAQLNWVVPDWVQEVIDAL